MARIYATLIRKGEKTIEHVPEQAPGSRGGSASQRTPYERPPRVLS